MKKGNVIIKQTWAVHPDNGNDLRRGMIYTFTDVKGNTHTGRYSKMCKGNFCFSDLHGNKFQLNKLGYVIPNL